MMEVLESRTLFSYAIFTPHIVTSSPITKYEGPALNAQGNDVPIDPIEINQESVTIVSTTSSSDPRT